jgi:hypothetical protein
MKKRNRHFLSAEKIDHKSEQFDYIAELHEYLWRFVRAEIPEANGSLKDWVDNAVEKAENRNKK